jgi:predicted site-specific integrase-resolvase
MTEDAAWATNDRIYLTRRELGDYLEVSTKTIERWQREGLPAEVWGRRLVRYKLDEEWPEPWMTRKTLAEHMQVSERTIDRWTGEGMPHVVWGVRTKRFRASEAEAWATQTFGPKLVPRTG